jgi:hypothetical protein
MVTPRLDDNSDTPRWFPVPKMKNPTGSEDAGGVFHALTSLKVAALEEPTAARPIRSAHCAFLTHGSRVPRQRCEGTGVIRTIQCEEVAMKKVLGVLATVAVVGAAAVAAPAPAEARHFGVGPGLAFGLAAGAIAAGAAASAYPYYGPGYGYYGPRYYGPGPYAYEGRPYYRHRYYYGGW